MPEMGADSTNEKEAWIPEAALARWAWRVSPYSSDCNSIPQGLERGFLLAVTVL